MMSAVISMADPSVYERLGEITALSFVNDPLRLAGFGRVSDAEYARYMTAILRSQAFTSSIKVVVLQAARPDTGEIIGWAMWVCPPRVGEDSEDVKGPAKMVALPEGTDEVGHAKHKESGRAARAMLMGERKGYGTSPRSHVFEIVKLTHF
jgi:hypothetical protein